MHPPGVFLSLSLSILFVTLLFIFPLPVTSKKGNGNNNGGTPLKDLIICKTCIFVEATESSDFAEAQLAKQAVKLMDNYFKVGTSIKLCMDKPKAAKNATTKKQPKKIPMCITWKGEFMKKKIELRFGIPIDPNATIKTRGGTSREISDGDCTGSVEGLGFPSGVDAVVSKLSDMDICLCNNDNECNDGRGGASSLNLQFQFPLISTLILPAIIKMLPKIRLV